MYFNKGEIDFIRAKGNSSHQAMKDHILGYVNKELGSSPSPSRNQSTLRLYGSKVYTFAFAYILTGDTRYADLAKNYLLTFASWEYWDTQPDTRDLALSAMLIGNALAYDWIYDYLNDSERDTIRNSLAAQAEKMYQAAIASSNVSGWNNWWSNSFLQNHTLINRSALGVAGLVLKGENGNADKYIENTRQGWERISALMDGNGDGSWHESTNYGAYAFTNSLVYLVNMKRINGTDQVPHKFFSAYGKWRAYNHIPGTTQHIIGMGDFEYSWGDNSSPHILRFAANEYGDGLAQWMADYIISTRGRYTNAYQAPEAVLEFLNYNPGVAATGPGSLSKNATFKDMEGVIWRSGWGSNDLIFGFKTGANGGRYAYDTYMNNSSPWAPKPATGQTPNLNVGHDHNDINSFFLYKNGSWLAPENNAYGKGDTKYHNSVLINGQGQNAPQDSNWNNINRSAGRTDGRLEEVLETPNFNLVKATATNAYSQISSLSNYRRSILLANKGYLLIYDVFQSSSNNTYTYVNHFSNSVARDGKWLKGHAPNNQILGVLPLNSDASVTTGNDGIPYGYIAVSGQNRAMVNFLAPATTSDWGNRPSAEMLSDLQGGSEVKVSFNDGSSDYWLYSYFNKNERTFSEYSYNGNMALISHNSNDVLVKLALFGASRVARADGQLIVEGLNGNKDYEILYQGTTLKILGELDVANSDVKIYAKNIQTIQVNGTSVKFTKSGDIAYLGSTAPSDLAPESVSVSPSNGSGMEQSFTATYKDPEGKMAWLYFRLSDGTNLSSMRYDITNGQIQLSNNLNNGWNSAEPGQAVTLENVNLVLDVSSVKYTKSDNDYSLVLPVSFKSSFSGAKGIYLNAVDEAGNEGGWTVKGSYTIASPPVEPELVSFDPANGSGSSQLFRIVVKDENGLENLKSFYFIMNGKVNKKRASFSVFYNPDNDIVKIKEGRQWSQGMNLADGGVLAGENAILDLGQSRAIRNGNELELQLFLKFNDVFEGKRTLKVNVLDDDKMKTGYITVGSYTVVASSSAPSIKSLKAGTTQITVGETEKFKAVFEDKDGDFDYVELLLRPKNREGISAVVRYDADSKKLFIQDNKGKFSISKSIGSRAKINNSYFEINLARSSAKVANGRLTLRLALQLNTPLLGEVDAMLYAEDLTGRNSGYQQKAKLHLNNKNSAKPTVDSVDFMDAASLEVKTRDNNGADDIYFIDYLAQASDEMVFQVRLYKEAGEVMYFDQKAAEWKGPFQLKDNLTVNTEFGRIDLSRFALTSSKKEVVAQMALIPGFAGKDFKEFVRVADFEGNLSKWNEINSSQVNRASAAELTIAEEGNGVRVTSVATANWQVYPNRADLDDLAATAEIIIPDQVPGIYQFQGRSRTSQARELVVGSVRVGLKELAGASEMAAIFTVKNSGDWQFKSDSVSAYSNSDSVVALSSRQVDDFYLKTGLEEFYGSDSSVEFIFAFEDENNYRSVEISLGAETTFALYSVREGSEELEETVTMAEADLIQLEIMLFQGKLRLAADGEAIIEHVFETGTGGRAGMKVNGRDNQLVLMNPVFAEIF